MNAELLDKEWSSRGTKLLMEYRGDEPPVGRAMGFIPGGCVRVGAQGRLVGKVPGEGAGW